jgi:hypothetical protein
MNTRELKELHEILQKGDPATAITESPINEAQRTALLARAAQERTSPVFVATKRQKTPWFLLVGLGATASMGILFVLNPNRVAEKTLPDPAQITTLIPQDSKIKQIKKPAPPIDSKIVAAVKAVKREHRKRTLRQVAHFRKKRKEITQRKEAKKREEIIPEQVIIEIDNRDAPTEPAPQNGTIRIALAGEKDKISTIIVTDVPSPKTEITSPITTNKDQ